MEETKQTIKDEFTLIASNNFAILDDASYIWDGEHNRSPMAEEHTAKKKTPIFILVPFIIRQLERPEVDTIIIDGTGTHFGVYSKSGDIIEWFSSEKIAITGPLPADEVKTNLALYFKTYYLLRYYFLGGSKKYAVTKLNEGFVVYTNDTENPKVWAGHKVY